MSSVCIANIHKCAILKPFFPSDIVMKTLTDTIRVRFAPSPTGYLHVGGLRTALYNYLYARKHGGTFVLRIEDTDRTRFVEGAAEQLAGTLSGLGLGSDEGVFADSDGHMQERGDKGPYIQSERLDIYRRHADELLNSGKAYPCFCTTERLDAMRAEQAAAKRMPKYDRLCLGLSPEEVSTKLAEGVPHVIRMKVEDDREVAFDDIVRGRVSFKTETIDDQVLVKSDGFPTYHLANVVDDHLMDITRVIRAEEWLPSTPKHILLYEAFGWEPPVFAHLPLLLNPDRSKLSKRQGDVAVEDYLAKGYLPEALINFVALLGWNPGEGSTQEIFSLDELVSRFELGDVHKAGAVFDLHKLDWMNAEYIKRLSVDALYEKAKPFFEAGYDEDFMKRVLSIEQDRLAKLSDVGTENPFFFAEPILEPSMIPWKKSTAEDAKLFLGKAADILSAVTESDWTRERLGEILLEAAGEQRGDFLWPLRVALSGKEKSPPPQDIVWVVGKDEALARVRSALALLP